MIESKITKILVDLSEKQDYNSIADCIKQY